MRMQMHTQTHTSTNTVSLAQTWTHKLSLRQTQSTAAWSVRGGSAAGDYQVWWIQMPSLLFFQPGPPCSSHNSPHIMSTVMWCSIVWNEGAKSCSTAQCVCRHQTVLWRSPLSSLYLTVWGGHIIPTTLIYWKHSLVSDWCNVLYRALYTHNA